MITPRNFKTKQISLQLYEFDESIEDYIRIDTIIDTIKIGESIKEIFKSVSRRYKYNIINKSFIMTFKNLEGLDMRFYMIKTDSDGTIILCKKISPDIIRL